MKITSTLDANQDAAGSTFRKEVAGQSLLDFFNYLVKKWWLFLVIGLLAGLVGVYYAYRQQTNFESNLTFVLQQEGNSGGVSGALSLAAQFGLNIGGGDDMFSGDNILEIIKSRRIIEKVFLSVDTFNNKPYTLIEYFIHHPTSQQTKENNSKTSNIHFLPNQNRQTFSYAQDSVLFITYKRFSTNNIEADRPDRKLSIFSIRIVSDDEKFTKIFTDRIIHATDSFYIEICSKKERETLEILEQRVAVMKGNLSASISSRATTQDANVNPAFAAAQIPLQKQQANIQVYGGAYAEMFKNLELARYQYLKKIPLIQIIDAAEYPMKKIKVGKLKTGIIFSLTAILLVVFIIWLKRIYKLAS